jgi:hypothetical protein
MPPPKQAATPTSTSQTRSAEIPPDQLDSLVAPIALYPDPLLAQVLAASTYPLEIVQLQQWLANHKTLKDKALADAVAKESWDPSIQAMAALPDVVNRLANEIQWTTDLGNAFLAQQSDVMDAVQRMRKKAQDKGNLTTTEQQKVETRVVENKSVIVIEQANPEVVYVPSYNPRDRNGLRNDGPQGLTEGLIAPRNSKNLKNAPKLCDFLILQIDERKRRRWLSRTGVPENETDLATKQLTDRAVEPVAVSTEPRVERFLPAD